MSSRKSDSQKRRKPLSSTALSSTLKLDSEPPNKKLKPLTALSKAPVFSLSSSRPKASQTSTPKGKGRARVQHETDDSSPSEDGRLWADAYEPTDEVDLAIHPRKFKDVQQWFLEAFEGGPSGKLRKYRRILVLTGPAGTAKTTAIRILSRDIGFDILEWRNSVSEQQKQEDEYGDRYDNSDGVDYEGLSDKFQSFLTRASNCSSFLGTTAVSSLSEASRSTSPQPSGRRARVAVPNSRRVVLLEDLPNILHPTTRAVFHSSLEGILHEPASAPVVIVISDAGIRGEGDSDGISGSQRWRAKDVDAFDIRTALSPALLNSPYVTHISFNPIAPTLMKRALQNTLNRHFASSNRKEKQPSKEVLDIIIETSNGDIRSAVMSLQFVCTTIAPEKDTSKNKNKTKGGRSNTRAFLEVMSRREQNLALFHLLGKIFYNKRKGDAPSQSTPAKDVQRDKELDLKLKDAPKLPPYLSHHDRKASRVDVEALYADTPIDASLLSLYIHQNYTQYCDGLDNCDGIIESLSWIDSNGGESWLQANPHQFHLVTLGTMHSLPTPVARRGQKPYKPEFFGNLKATREGEDGLKDVQDWLRRVDGLEASWTRQQIALEMGGVLKSCDLTGLRPPHTHRNFSRLDFIPGTSNFTDVVGDGDVGYSGMYEEEPSGSMGSQGSNAVAHKDQGGWLDTDDIEEF